ncbi:CDH6 [Branchiostoma lanceolatum]|uniref:CDH6 protein n=1 Tax=Branchiostoma lanceolatum TaxID=7740 RepID=A0A8J9V8H2_BRALA|nr:CDH6 [Branchiostoma lanceolatum]
MFLTSMKGRPSFVLRSLLITVFFLGYFGDVSCDRFVDKGGYLLWNVGRNVLDRAEDRLEFSFRYCNDKGLLIYQQGEGQNYFALGVTEGRLYIEASIEDRVVEVFIGESTQDVVLKNHTHEVIMTGLRGLDSDMRITINGTEYPPQILTVVSVELSFSSPAMSGQTLVGGYKNIIDLRLNTQRLKAYPIVCMFYIRTGEGEDLSALSLTSTDESLGASDTCHTCPQPSTVSMTTLTSYIEMQIDKTPTTNTVINFKFRTKAPNGLLLYFGGPAYLAVYLRSGALVLRLNTKGSGVDAVRQSTRVAPFNDGEWQEITIRRDNNVATMYSLAGDVLARVEFVGESSDTAHVLNAEKLFVGGVADPRGLPSDMRTSFRGCLDDLRFSVGEDAPLPYEFQRQNVAFRDVEFSCMPNQTCESYPCRLDRGEACDVGVCECAEGYRTVDPVPLTCENIDDCGPDPCQNGAICTDLIADYNCACTEQYKGKNCTVDRNCYYFPCYNGGSCLELDTPTRNESGRNCTCAHGFTADDCSVVDYCADNPCGVGVCNNYLSGYNCTCPDDPDEIVKDRQNCGPLAVRSPIQISPAALVIVLFGVAILMVVVIVFLAFRRSYLKRKRDALLDYPKSPVYEESRENVVEYGEEGYGEEDQDTFDVNVIQSAGDTLKHRKKFPVLSPEDAAQVEDFISSRLSDADVDTNAGARDQKMSFADEGRGTPAASLSSLNSSSTEEEQSYVYLQRWGPRFSRLSDMFNDGQSDSD